MGNLAFDLMAQGKTVLFSFEEAIGKIRGVLKVKKFICFKVVGLTFGWSVCY